MAIAFDATSISAQTSDSSAPVTISWSHTCSGIDRILLVGMSLSSQANTVSSITYDGVDLTKIRETVNAGDNIASLWYLVAPATGSNTITAIMNSSMLVSFGMAVSLTGVDQTNPIENDNGTTADAASSVSTTVTSKTDGAWIVDVVTKESAIGVLTVGSGQTQRQNTNGTSIDVGMSTVNGKSPAGDEAMDWDDGGSAFSFAWSIAACAVRPFIPLDFVQQHIPAFLKPKAVGYQTS